MKKHTIDIDGKEITVEKLPLGKYAELLKAIKQLPQNLTKYKDLPPTDVLTVLPEIIGESYPDFVAILTIATPLTEEEIDKIGLDDAVRLVIAIIEVNNYREVYDMAKKALARPQAQKSK